MKQLIQFIFPTVKAIIAAVGFMVGIGWGAYSAVSIIAKTEAGTVRDEIKELRAVDMEHLNKRFDRIEMLIKEH